MIRILPDGITAFREGLSRFGNLVQLLALRLLLILLTAVAVLFRRAGRLHLLLLRGRRSGGIDIHDIRRKFIRGTVLITHSHVATGQVLLDRHVHGSVRVALGLHVDGAARLTCPELAVRIVRLVGGTAQGTFNRPGVGGQA